MNKWTNKNVLKFFHFFLNFALGNRQNIVYIIPTDNNKIKQYKTKT